MCVTEHGLREVLRLIPNVYIVAGYVDSGPKRSSDPLTEEEKRKWVTTNERTTVVLMNIYGLKYEPLSMATSSCEPGRSKHFHFPTATCSTSWWLQCFSTGSVSARCFASSLSPTESYRLNASQRSWEGPEHGNSPQDWPNVFGCMGNEPGSGCLHPHDHTRTCYWPLSGRDLQKMQ